MKYQEFSGKVFSTGNIKFVVEAYEPITEHSANLCVRLLDAGYFSNVTISFGTDEIQEGLLSGQIWQVD